MNKKLIQYFTDAAHTYEMLGDVYRAAAYRKALHAPAGSHIKEKIREFEATGRIAALDALFKGREIRAYKTFLGVLGVGPTTARAWIKRKIFTISALSHIKLTRVQQLGVMHRADLARRIPRAEVGAIGAQIIKLIKIANPLAQSLICGSYRRGSPDSGDVDVLTTATALDNVLTNKHVVAIISRGPAHIQLLWKSTIYVRAVDIVIVAPESMAAGTLYLTGPWEYNEQLRALAKRAGYKLNQNGLYKDGVLIPTATEAEIIQRMHQTRVF